MDIKFLQECKEETLSTYKTSKNNLLWLEQYRLENQNYRDYEGREILELLQNADDARSESVDISLDSERHILTIKNYGPETKPFTNEGMRSIMNSYLSPKKNEDHRGERLIGAKGLGFKSILNWTSEIVIKSDNVSVRFGEDVVRGVWEELKQGVEDYQEYEAEARRNGHQVPLPILRIPQISECQEIDAKTTIIELRNVPKEVEGKIKESLCNFQPESLLFLHHLRSIIIKIDGNENRYDCQKISEDEGIVTYGINDTRWIVSHGIGEVDNRHYEVAAAFNLNTNSHEGNRLYTFFPTEEYFPFPCILHATLELNASRKAILTGEKVNSEIMRLLARRMIAVADALKKRRHGWDAYNLVTGYFYDGNYGGYVKELRDTLSQLTTDKEYIPIIIPNEYANANDCYYYSDSFFDFVKDNHASGIFSKMMLAGAPRGFKNRRDNEARKHIEALAKSLTNYSTLARFIKIVYDYYCMSGGTNNNTDLHILKDDKGDVIQGTAYLNTGRVIDNIPAFLDIRYVNDELKSALLEEFGRTGTELDRVRYIATSLKGSITNVSASDVSGIKRLLILSSNDNGKYDSDQINQIVSCLFNLYKSKTSEFKNTNVDCYLPSEDGKLRPARELIFGDERFPDGIDNLNLKHPIYRLEDRVAYPDSLISDETGDNEVQRREIQNFYNELGVNKYFNTKSICYGDDREYLKANHIAEDKINNATSERIRGDYNRTNIPVGLDKWSILGLTDLIRLICTSGLINDVLQDLDLRWYYNKMSDPEQLKINYISYLLQKKTAAKKLSCYIISSKEWVLDRGDDMDYNANNDRVLLLLKRLGAKSSYADFSPDELYKLINTRADECKKSKNYTGIKDFYHRIKMAFVAIGGNHVIPDDIHLDMLCTLDGKDFFKDSREIFYSNNEISQKLKKQLPILALQLRDGEDEVSRYFGCRRIKDLKVILSEVEDNPSLTNELNAHVRKCKPYILALVSKDSGSGTSYDNDKKTLIEQISMNVVKSASYYFDHKDIHTEPETLSDGEFVITEKIPQFCCKMSNIADALANPKFCNSVAEAICVALNLSSRDNNDKFYRIIKSTDRELEFLRDSIDPRLWLSCQEAFGISDNELEFWKQVFYANGRAEYYDREQIKEQNKCYIAKYLDIPTDRASQSNFTLYHIQQLRRERDRYVADYRIWLHQDMCKNPEKQRKYLGKIALFQSNEWTDTALGEKEILLITPDYRDVIMRRIKKISALIRLILTGQMPQFPKNFLTTTRRGFILM